MPSSHRPSRYTARLAVVVKQLAGAETETRVEPTASSPAAPPAPASVAEPATMPEVSGTDAEAAPQEGSAATAPSTGAAHAAAEDICKLLGARIMTRDIADATAHRGAGATMGPVVDNAPRLVPKPDTSSVQTAPWTKVPAPAVQNKPQEPMSEDADKIAKDSANIASDNVNSASGAHVECPGGIDAFTSSDTKAVIDDHRGGGAQPASRTEDQPDAMEVDEQQQCMAPLAATENPSAHHIRADPPSASVHDDDVVPESEDEGDGGLMWASPYTAPHPTAVAQEEPAATEEVSAETEVSIDVNSDHRAVMNKSPEDVVELQSDSMNAVLGLPGSATPAVNEADPHTMPETASAKPENKMPTETGANADCDPVPTQPAFVDSQEDTQGPDSAHVTADSVSISSAAIAPDVQLAPQGSNGIASSATIGESATSVPVPEQTGCDQLTAAEIGPEPDPVGEASEDTASESSQERDGDLSGERYSPVRESEPLGQPKSNNNAAIGTYWSV